jgi:hypothetical protein
VTEPDCHTAFNDEAAGWRISSFSTTDACVAVARMGHDSIVLRNSNHPGDGVVSFNRREIEAFLLGVKAGEFDDFAT